MLNESHLNLKKKQKKNHNPDTKGQILLDPTFRRSLEQSNSETEREWRLPGVGCEEEEQGISG